ncbi:EthD family reductase [Pseudonocardia sp. GCM10023141]|uniref:EthD family reductase n=1 Tax=Pseudonocardia sp. GCM10023141 TaxID=3252653 RepID=UPI003611EF7F
MYQLTVLYNQPADPAAFDKYYDDVHTPLATKIPGLQRLSVSRPAPGPDGATPAYHLIAVLEFASAADFGAGMGSAEGQAAAADVANFGQAGAMMLSGEAGVI